MRIAVLGAAFKPGTDDVRDSPALDVARRLQQAGALVTVHDPEANLTARAVAPSLRYAANPVVACRKAEIVLHLTPWPQFAALDPAELGDVVRRRVLVDARNCLGCGRLAGGGLGGRRPRAARRCRSAARAGAWPPSRRGPFRWTAPREGGIMRMAAAPNVVT